MSKRVSYKRYGKLMVLVCCATHLIVAAVASAGPTPDVHQLAGLLDRLPGPVRVERLVADAGFDSAGNHKLLRDDHGIVSTIPAVAGRPSVTGNLPADPYRRLMKTRFNRAAYPNVRGLARGRTCMAVAPRRPLPTACWSTHSRASALTAGCSSNVDPPSALARREAPTRPALHQTRMTPMSETSIDRRTLLTAGAASLAALAFANPADAGTRVPPEPSAKADAAGRFAGKVALVTGGTSGIGRATARAFAMEGARVVFNGRREALGAEVAAEIKSAGGDATYHKSDVSKETEVEALVASVVKQHGFGIYHATKHAVLGLTKSAALDYAKQNVCVTAVCPGLIRTDMMTQLAR